MREDLAVARLVIVGRVRKRNQDPRQTKKRQLGETGSARARDGKIRRAVNFFHAMMKRRDKRRNFFSAVIIGNEALIARAGEMNHLERSEEHTSELQSQSNLVCRLLLEKKK